jgi:hypothetical protein
MVARHEQLPACEAREEAQALAHNSQIPPGGVAHEYQHIAPRLQRPGGQSLGGLTRTLDIVVQIGCGQNSHSAIIRRHPASHYSFRLGYADVSLTGMGQRSYDALSLSEIP